MSEITAKLHQLEQVLRALPPFAVAVSGGVDSMTLAVLAHRVRDDVDMVHAASAAVPAAATERVREWGWREGWTLRVIDVREFENEQYLANPVDRCFHCKSQLYGSIHRLSPRLVVSGANVDDLGEYRPGLDAARNHGVRHPYLEAGIDKRGVRALARDLALGEVADLPSSPCLSSRIETGIRIVPSTLGFVHAVETLVAAQVPVRTVRCRVRADGIVVEIDAGSLAALDDVATERLRGRIAQQASAPSLPIRFEPYRNGSAFLTANVTARAA